MNAATPPRRHAATPPRRHAATPPRRHAATPPRRHAATPPRILVGLVGLSFSIAAIGVLIEFAQGKWDVVSEVADDHSETSTNPSDFVTEVSLPTVFVGQSCETTVELPNRGIGRSRLTGLDMGCSCLSADLTPQELAAGTNGVLAIRLRAVETVGPFGQRITAYFDDDSGPKWRATIIVRGEARSWAEISSKVVDWGELRPGEVATASIRVKPEIATPITLRTLTPDLVLTPNELLEAKAQTEYDILVSLHVDAHAAKGSYHDAIELIPSQVNLAPLRVPVLYRVAPPISWSPKRILITHATAGVSSTHRIELNREDGESVGAPRVSHGLGEALHCELESPSGDGKAVILRVEFHPDSSRAFWSSDINLDFGKFSLTIPFAARVQLNSATSEKGSGDIND